MDMEITAKMDKVNVEFISDDGSWLVEMTYKQLDIIAAHKPLLDGKCGAEVYQIDELRYDIDQDQFAIWISLYKGRGGNQS